MDATLDADEVDEALTPSVVVPQRLRPPRVRQGQLPRSELISRVQDTDAPVVVVRAAAGYGKSTLLSQLTEADERPSGWLTLHPSDDDPIVLAHHLLRALGTAGLDVAGLGSQLAGAEPQLWRRVVPELATAMDRHTTPFLLILDDTHLLSSTRSWELVDRVVGLVPDGSTVVVSGRAAPHIHRARRAVDGGLIELTQDDLAFTPDESRSFVVANVPTLDNRLVDQLVDVTEGWPVGVDLSILALRTHEDPPLLLSGFLTSDRQLVDYLQEEVLAGLDASTRRFLAEVSVLPHLSGRRCDATTGRSDSAEVLTTLVDSGNLLVTPVTGAADEYRIHQLFAELLLRELRRLDPDREPVLRRAAALWEDVHGDADAAVDQALGAGDVELAARIVYRHHSRMVLSGQIATLERWIDSFPPGSCDSDGLLALSAGWAALSTGRATDLRHHLDVARGLELDGPLPDGTQRFELACTALEMISAFDGVKGTARNAQMLVDAGEQAGPWAVLARSQLAVATSMLDDADHRELFAAAEVATRAQPGVHAVTIAQLAVCEVRDGDVAAGDRFAEAAVEELADHDLSAYPLVAIVFCAASLTAALVGDRRRSRERCADGEALLTSAGEIVGRARAQAMLLLAKAALARGDVPVAVRLVPQARTVLLGQPDAVALHRQLDEVADLLEHARMNPEIHELSGAERRVLEQLATHRTLIEIADGLCVSRNTVKSHTRAIYSKLGVSSRSMAVARAQELGLLDGGGQHPR